MPAFSPFVGGDTALGEAAGAAGFPALAGAERLDVVARYLGPDELRDEGGVELAARQLAPGRDPLQFVTVVSDGVTAAGAGASLDWPTIGSIARKRSP